MSFPLSRYEQHIELPNVGIEGQEKIHHAKVLIVGAGGLGCPVAQYLVAAGVGTVGLVDGDKVEKSNLQRQVLFTNKDLGVLKVDAAKERLKDLCDNQTIDTYPYFIEQENAEELIRSYDIIIDATDNHVARLLINKLCIKHKKPWIYAALFHFEGQLMVFNENEKAPCFKCVFPNLKKDTALPTCKSAGVLSPVPGIIGSMQATEALKLILKFENTEKKYNLYLFNALTYNLTTLEVLKDSSCEICNHV